MAKAQFAALPMRAIGDGGLTDGDLRVLAAVAAYDRLSLSRGKGQGSWASHNTMAGWIGRNYANFSTSMNKLLRLGYLVREARATDRRQFTYRVVYTDDDRVPNGKDVCPVANEAPEIVCLTSEEGDKIVCPDDQLTRSKEADNQSQYIPQRGEIDSVETEEINSAKLRVADAPRLARRMIVQFRDGEPLHETLAKFERQWKADWTVFRDNLTEWVDWLLKRSDELAASDSQQDRIAVQRAERLAGTVDEWRGFLDWESNADKGDAA